MNRFIGFSKGLPIGLAIIFLLVSGYVAAEDVEPEEPGIVLPPTLLEVADLQVEEISAIVPDDYAPTMPEFHIPLPKADEIFLPEEKFDVPYPDQLEGGQIGIVYRPERRADIFSEGEIAVGSMNHVRGDLNLYRLGPDPRFDLRFYHDKIDGYGSELAGSGFFHSDDRLEGSLSVDLAVASIEAEAGITESSEGLQEIGDFEVLTYRRVYGNIHLGYPLTETLDLHGTVGSSYAQQILSFPAPSISAEPGAEFGAEASIGLDLRTPYVDLDSSLLYGLLNATTPAHRIVLNLASRFLPTESLTLGLSAGVVWDRLIDFRFPFSSSVSWQPSDLFGLSASAGYLVRFPTVGMLRQDFRFIGLDTTLKSEYGWFANTEVQSRLTRSAILFGSVDFEFLESGYGFLSTIDETTGLFGLYERGGNDAALLEAEVGLDIEIRPNLTFSASWNGRFLGDHPFAPDHEITSAFGFIGAGDTFGGEVAATVPLTIPVMMPTLRFSGYYRISESVRFSLDIEDPLAPLLPDGRPYWGPYKAPGFLIFLAMNISL